MRSEAPALLPIFRSQHQAELLSWLLLHPDQEYAMTELANRIGVPLNTLHREAQRLIAAGLLTSRSVGRSRLLSASATHYAIRPLTELLQVSFGPRSVVAEEFADVVGAERVLIFGSWAERYRGTAGTPPRDIDVMVVGTPGRGDVYDAADRAQARLGLEVNPSVRSAEQWQAGTDALVGQIQSSAYVTVLPAATETTVTEAGEGA